MHYVVIDPRAKVVVTDFDGSFLTYHDKRIAEYAALILTLENPGTRFTTSGSNQSYWKCFNKRKILGNNCGMRLEENTEAQNA